MAHPTQQVPPRAFSPAQHSPSPVATQPGFALPGANVKRPQSHISPAPQSQPGSPYSTPSYPGSPNVVGTPTTTATPSYAHLQPAPAQHVPHYQPQPYANGNTIPNPPYQPRPIHIPLSAAPPVMSAPPTPQPGTPGGHYAQATFAPTVPLAPGNMPPPPPKAQRTYEYEVTDSLLGTGVDIREEENALAEYYAGSFGQDSRTGFPANAPSGRASFYGAGLASQPGVPATASQKETEAALAERAWKESAARLSAQRASEHNDPFLCYANLHARAQKIAVEHGLELNLDVRNQPVQKSRNPAEYPAPKVTVTTKTGPDGALMSVHGTVLPQDSFLIDQLALLSIGTKQRVRELIEDADKIATTRQQTSHGIIAAEWLDYAAPLDSAGRPIADNDANTNGDVEGGNQRKRSFDASNASAVSGRPPVNHLAQVLRDMGKREREAEEARLRKRQKRLQGDVTASVSRAGSVAPGTPGSVAPEPEKAPTKKEQKKMAAQKHDASAESVNKTTMKFLGGGKKKYSWMTGGAGSGPSAPSRPSGGTPGTPASAGAPKAPENTALTKEGRYKLGTWREYGEKGKNIQMRDWVNVLERDGREKLALQYAYVKLDDSEPR